MNDYVVIIYNGEQVSVPKEVADFLEQDRKRQQAQDKQDARHLSKSEFETVLSGLECVKRPVKDCLLTENGGDRSDLWHPCIFSVCLPYPSDSGLSARPYTPFS